MTTCCGGNDMLGSNGVGGAAFMLRDGLRGVPPGQSGVRSDEVAQFDWQPFDGKMSLPLLSLDIDAYSGNRSAMIKICQHFGISIAPHAKTPMSPALAADLVENGAWAISVADIRQAAIMLDSGLTRIVIANEIGGRNAIKRLAHLLSRFPNAEVHVFVDSEDFVEALDSVWRQDPNLPALGLLLEVGCGRGGVQTHTQVDGIVRAVERCDNERLSFSGVATYEGTANTPDAAQLKINLDELFQRVEAALTAVRKSVAPNKRLILTAGGSSLFDHVITRSLPIIAADRDCVLVLRCGAVFFCDHGPISARLQAMAQRSLLGDAVTDVIAHAFKPTLRIWAEVLSVHDDVAICGLGLRDVAHDQGLPIPLRVWTDGKLRLTFPTSSSVPKLNDQHAFVPCAGTNLRVGDVIEFGICHPCTTLDKHSVIYGLDGEAKVASVFPTFFG
jgi:D-serine dehydratase